MQDLCFTDNKKYNQILHKNTVFPYLNYHKKDQIDFIVLSFRFQSIAFNKKRVLPFFLALELLANRKPVSIISKTNLQAWKVRKGILVGCKVTLRRHAVNDFIDRLSLTFARIEKFQPSKGFFDNFFKKDVKLGAFNSHNLTLNELSLFYPIELGLGRHIDVKQVQCSFHFSQYSLEERFFFLRHNKVPIRN